MNTLDIIRNGILGAIAGALLAIAYHLKQIASLLETLVSR